MEFTFRLPESTAEFKFDAARLAESHPRLHELRERMIEKAGGNERVVDNELGMRFFESLHKFGDGYVKEMSGIIERIFKTRDDLSAIYDAAVKGGDVKAEAVKAKFDELAADMARLKPPEKALADVPKVDLAAGEGAKKGTPSEPHEPPPSIGDADLDVWKGDASEADFEALLDDIENKAEVPRVEGGRIEGKRVPGPPRRPRDPSRWAEWNERVAHWFKRRANKLNIWNLVRRPGESFRASLARTLDVMGTKISDHPEVLEVWNKAREKVLNGRSLEDISRDEMLGKGAFDGKSSMYDKVRDQFWTDMLASGARDTFEDAGLKFGDGLAPNLETTNPDVNPADIKVSLDHIVEKAQGENWKKAIDGENLRFEFADPNTFREIWQVRHRVRK